MAYLFSNFLSCSFIHLFKALKIPLWAEHFCGKKAWHKENLDYAGVCPCREP